MVREEKEEHDDGKLEAIDHMPARSCKLQNLRLNAAASHVKAPGLF
jgi:hypothetical protein